MILRDSHGVAQVRYVTGNKILRILKAKGKIICNNLCRSPSELFRPGHVKMITVLMVCLYLVLIRVSGKSSWRSLFPYQEGSFCSKTSWKAQEGGFVQSITSYVSPAVFYTSIPCVIPYYPWIRHTVKLLALWPFTCRSDEWGSRLLMHMANFNFESLYPSYSTCLI